MKRFYATMREDKWIEEELTDEQASDHLKSLRWVWEITEEPSHTDPILQGAQADIQFLLDYIDELKKERNGS